MSKLKILLSIAFLLCLTLSSQAQVGLGKYSKKENKETKFYYVTEFGLGQSILLNDEDFSEEHYDIFGEYHYHEVNKKSFNIYANWGFMYNLDSKWGIGLHQNISLSSFHYSVDPTLMGLRGRLSYHLGDIEMNVSPGFRWGFDFERRGLDIESTISWKDHIGIYTRYEKFSTPNSSQPDVAEVFSLGIFTKGKKGYRTIIISAISAGFAFLVAAASFSLE